MYATNNNSQYKHPGRYIGISAYTEEESEEIMELMTMDLCHDLILGVCVVCILMSWSVS